MVNNTAPRRFASDMTVNIPDDALAVLPSQNNLRRTSELMTRSFPRIRNLLVSKFQMNTVLPPSYATRFAFFSMTLTQRTMKMESKEINRNRVKIFATDEMMALLASADHWMAYGRFKYAPDKFYQLYIIHSIVGEDRHPCVYVILTNK